MVIDDEPALFHALKYIDFQNYVADNTIEINKKNSNSAPILQILQFIQRK